MDVQVITGRVRAMIDKAESTDYAEERDLFMKKAFALMERHRITEAMLESAAEGADRRGKLTIRNISLGAGPYVRGRLRLLDSIAGSQSCQCLTRTTWEGRVGEVHGFESDLQRVDVLYTSLLTQAVSEASDVEIPTGVHATKVRRSFLFGFADEVGVRLAEAHRETVETYDTDEQESVALVLLDRSEEVANGIKRRYGKIRPLAPPSGSTSTEGYMAGLSAGVRADIGSGRIAGPQKAIVS